MAGGTQPSAEHQIERTSLGRLLTLAIGSPAAGGTFVARHEGRVVFVRGAAPGETVVARLVEDERDSAKARYWRAETLEVLEPSPDRVPSVWPEAGTDGVGGAEWAHIGLHAQRRLATEVLQELLGRAGVRSFPLEEVQVEPAPHDGDGLGWRTRVRFAVDEAGRIGMRGWRSHDVREVGENPLADPRIQALRLQDLAPADFGLALGQLEAIDVSAPSSGRPAVVLLGEGIDPAQVRIPAALAGADIAVQSATGIVPLAGDGLLTEVVGERTYRVGATGFWQVHRQAATVLSEVVAAELGARRGDRIWDLYGGVGLFAGALAPLVGEEGRVITVEGDRRASALAAQNLADLPQAAAETGDATAWVRAQRERPDRVVLDPPRAGAGVELMGLLAAAVRERIVYVSCEPSTLARDLAAAEAAGWRIQELRAFDLFPHTHHIESMAVLVRAS